MSFPKPIKGLKGIRLRLVLVYSALLGLGLTFFGLFLSSEYLEFQRNEYDQAMRNFAIDLSTFVKESQKDGIYLDIPVSERIKFFPFLIQETVVTLRNLDGDILYTSNKDVVTPYRSDLPRSPRYTYRLLSFRHGDQNYRAMNMKIHTNDRYMIIQVANKTESLNRQEQRLTFILYTTIPVLILISGLISIFLAGRALSPINETIQHVEELIHSGSFRPMEINPTGDEIEELVHTFNHMLAQVERTLNAKKQFVANASHQLNTPLAIIKGELEVLRSKERTPQEIERFHDSLKEELDHLIAMVQNMLLVARVESGKESFVFSPTRLDEVVMSCIVRLNKAAKKKNVTLTLNIDPKLAEEDHLEVWGDRQLLNCVCENLIENSIKYGPDNGQVSIELLSHNKSVAMEIKDKGPGFTDERLDGLTSRPFSRGLHTAPGSGVGLFLVGKVLFHLNAKIVAKNLPAGGAHVRVEFPPLPLKEA